MSEIKKISIIIRTLNEERYLGELLESIARQELSENYQIETIIVDLVLLIERLNCKNI